MNKLLLFLTVTFLLISCSNKFIETSHENIVVMNSSATFKGHFYIGSDKTHHYFIEKWKYGKDRKLKVNKADLKINKEIVLNSAEIKLCPWNPKKFKVEELGKTKDRIIYKYK